MTDTKNAVLIFRSAARYNKGVKVLCSVAVEHFVLVAFSIQRGAKHADRCLDNVQNIVHCKLCQRWAVNYCPSVTVYGMYSE